MKEKILLLDFGASYNQFIIKKLRTFGVYTEMVDHDIRAEDIKKDASIIGVILSGSPSTVYLENGLTVDKDIFKLGIPVLGICYGMQLMAHQLGGQVEAMSFTEKGEKNLTVESDNPLVFDNTRVYMDHGDHVTKLPTDFINHAHTEDNQYSLISNIKQKLYGTQFHPEKDETRVLERFALDICNAKNDWTIETYLKDQIKVIRETVQDKKVLLALSGGFKSSLTAAILDQAINDQLVCVYIDNGLSLNNDPLKLIKEHYNYKILEIDAKERILNKLKDIKNPEKKRKIIGEETINILKETADKFGGIKFLAQATDYIQVLESGNPKTGKFVKSHHNVGGILDIKEFQLIEPLRPLFKEELVKLAEVTKLPKDLINQPPFPGEGLAIRIMGKVTQDKLRIVRESDAILKDEVHKSFLDSANTQFFTVLTDTKSVTTVDFKRRYEYALVIRAVINDDYMSEVFLQIEFHTLRLATRRILKEVKGVNRVLLDMTSQDPDIVEWE